MHVLKDKFKNKPAVILSAGPSLDKNIENLKPYRDKVVVFCVGVAFKTAVKHGIIPDFVAVIDNKKEIIDIPEIADVNLIASTNTFEGIFELKPKRFFNHHNKNTPACVWLAKVLGITNLDEYETAGTVAINCLYTAKLMGWIWHIRIINVIPKIQLMPVLALVNPKQLNLKGNLIKLRRRLKIRKNF